MAPAFVKIIYDASPSSLPLPAFYNDVVRNFGFPVEHVRLSTGSQIWHVYIKATTNGCFITDGWSNVFSDLGIEKTDFIFFEVLSANAFHIYHFKIDRDLNMKDSFYHVMMFPEAKNLWLPKKFMEHNFNDDILENNVTIRYAPNQERTVRIKKLWDIHYYILDFSQISTDLSLVKWDFLVFHRVETYTFNLIVFRLLGDGSLVAEIGIPLPELILIPEPEYQAENDIEVGDQHSQTEDQIAIEDINYDNDVNVDNQVYDDEELPVHGNPPLPVNDVYEIEWVLTYRFRFPQRFVENVPLDNVKAMNVQTMNGVSVVLEIRSERSRGAPRYAFRGWERFMRQVGLVSGRAYVLRYERNNGVLVISEVIPHIF
ncbi:putative transcription factor B3-Domain family [Helianthus annuus]|nr:putative transcription factor B3-Domain family [Helianthus annuus]KAJ0720227.1 putative transcription factor B3-Domain family [Helianthus annuus]